MMIVNGFQFPQPDLCSVGAQACFAEKGQVCPGPVATDNRSRGASCQISRINLVRNQPRLANKGSMWCISLATTKHHFTKRESTHFVVFCLACASTRSSLKSHQYTHQAPKHTMAAARATCVQNLGQR